MSARQYSRLLLRADTCMVLRISAKIYTHTSCILKVLDEPSVRTGPFGCLLSLPGSSTHAGACG